MLVRAGHPVWTRLELAVLDPLARRRFYKALAIPGTRKNVFPISQPRKPCVERGDRSNRAFPCPRSGPRKRRRRHQGAAGTVVRPKILPPRAPRNKQVF